MIKLSSGRALSFEQYGDPTGIPVIGFHGTPGSRLALQVISEAAKANNLRVIAADRPGYGRSDPISRSSFSLYVRDIAELADALLVDKFIAWGTSGGGPFALACAAELPKRVILVGIVSGIGPLRNRHSMRGMIAANRTMFNITRISPVVGSAIISRMIKASLPSMKAHVRNGTSPSASINPQTFAIVQFDQEEAIRNGGKGICFDMTLLWQKWDFELADIEAPVHIWHGDKDNLAPPELARYVAANVPNDKLVMYSGEDHVGPMTKHINEIMQILSIDAHKLTGRALTNRWNWRLERVLGVDMLNPCEIEATERAYNTQAEIIPGVSYISLQEQQLLAVADRILVGLGDRYKTLLVGQLLRAYNRTRLQQVREAGESPILYYRHIRQT